MANTENAIESVLNDAENSVEALMTRGLEMLEAMQYSEALEVFTQLEAMAPHKSAVFLHLGTTHYQLKEYESAEAEFQKAIALDPMEGNAYLNLGNLYYKQDNIKKAVHFWELFKKVGNKNNPNVWLNLGVAYDKLGDPEMALENYSVYIGLQPLTQEAARLRVRFDSGKKTFENNILVAEKTATGGDKKKARDIYASALGIYPGTPRLYKMYASLLYQEQDFPRALEFYLRAFRGQPEDPGTLINIGVIYEKQGRFVDAMWAYSLAKNYKSQEQAQVGERLKKLLETHKNSFRAYLDEGQANYRQQKYDDAKAKMERLRDLAGFLGAVKDEAMAFADTVEEALDPKLKAAKTYYNMGRDAHTSGRFDQAMSFYDKYLQVAPKGDKAEEVKKHLGDIRQNLGAVLSSLLGDA